MQNRFEKELGSDLGHDIQYEVLRTFDFRGLKVRETRKSQYYEGTSKSYSRGVHTWHYPAVVSLIFLAHQSQIQELEYIWIDKTELIAAVPFVTDDSLLSINLSDNEFLPERWKELIDFSKWKQGNLYEEWEEPQELKIQKSESLLGSVGLKINQTLFSRVFFEAWNGQVCVKFGKKSVEKGFSPLRTSQTLRTYLYFKEKEKLQNFVLALNSDSLKKFFWLIEECEVACKESLRLNRYDKRKEAVCFQIESLKKQIHDYWGIGN
jgi:hypothetical protein